MGIFDKIKGVGGEMANLKNAGMDKVKGTLKDFEENRNWDKNMLEGKKI